MKKLFSLLVLGMICVSASAQFRDMVTLQDTDVYMFNPLPSDLVRGKSFSYAGTLLLGLNVQQYIPHDNVTVYGIALTLRSWTGANIIYQNPNYHAVLMQRAQGVPDSILDYHNPGSNPVHITFRTLSYLDSMPLDTTQQSMYFTKFRYEFYGQNKPFDTVTCYELYFDNPQVMTDTFYVGRKMIDVSNLAAEYSGFKPITSYIRYFWYSGLLDTTMFSDHNPNDWGFVFPIIGFHCNPLDEENHSLLLTDITNNGATVHWYSVEEGATYNVRVSSVDGSVDTVVVTTDSSYTFSGLPTNTRYTVQVRKQCYYATASYDTTVYSPWTSSSSFLLGSDECPPVSNLQATPSTHSVSVTWDSCPYYSAVQLNYGPRSLPHTQWTLINLTDTITHCTLTGLEAGTHYGIMARGICERVGQESPWTEQTYYFSTPSDTTQTGIVSIGGVDFTFSPNPAHGTVVLTLEQAAEGAELTLCDLGGRELRREHVSGTTHTLDVATLPAGVYFLKLTTPQGVATRRLLVE